MMGVGTAEVKQTSKPRIEKVAVQKYAPALSALLEKEIILHATRRTVFLRGDARNNIMV